MKESFLATLAVSIVVAISFNSSLLHGIQSYTLECKDKKKIEDISKSILEVSTMLKTIISDRENNNIQDNIIPLPDISAEIMRTLLLYMQAYYNALQNNIFIGDIYGRIEALITFNCCFMRLEALNELIKVAFYLDCPVVFECLLDYWLKRQLIV